MGYSKYWLMEPHALNQYRELERKFKADQYTKQLNDYLEQVKIQNRTSIKVANGVAEISIRGVLGNWNDFYDFLYWGSLDSYPSIIAGLDLAEQDEEVERIRLIVDSPGGRANGLFDLLYAIQNVSKPIEAVVETLAASAAYGIISQVDKVIAQTELSEIGSIGVGTSIWISNNLVDITSTESPKKWPDVTTEEGKKVIIEELDEWHDKFVNIIAEGRSAATGKNITVKDVNKNFGQGSILLAENAFKWGMIDEIAPKPVFSSNAAYYFKEGKAALNFSQSVDDKKSEEEQMDKKTLKNKHPELYAEIVQEGKAAEGDRVKALLIAGKNSGQTDYSLKCIEEDKNFSDQIVQANFLTGNMKKKDMKKRETDNPDPVKNPDPEKDNKESEMEKKVEAHIKRNNGK